VIVSWKVRNRHDHMGDSVFITGWRYRDLTGWMVVWYLLTGALVATALLALATVFAM